MKNFEERRERKGRENRVPFEENVEEQEQAPYPWLPWIPRGSGLDWSGRLCRLLQMEPPTRVGLVSAPSCCLFGK